MLTQDDHYKGYVLPAGTMVFANTWAIHHDEDEYEEPNKFNPDRWLDNKYGTRTNNDDSQEQRNVTYSWGSGRRVCSGQKLAENSLRMVIAKLVWTFDISKEDGGAEVDTSVESAYQGGFLIAPNKFPVRIRPRSEKHAKVVEGEFADLKSFYERFV